MLSRLGLKVRLKSTCNKSDRGNNTMLMNIIGKRHHDFPSGVGVSMYVIHSYKKGQIQSISEFRPKVTRKVSHIVIRPLLNLRARKNGTSTYGTRNRIKIIVFIYLALVYKSMNRYNLIQEITISNPRLIL